MLMLTEFIRESFPVSLGSFGQSHIELFSISQPPLVSNIIKASSRSMASDVWQTRVTLILLDWDALKEK